MCGKNKPKFTVVQSTNNMYDEEQDENITRSNSPATNNDSGHNNSDCRFESLWKRSNTSGNIFNKYT